MRAVGQACYGGGRQSATRKFNSRLRDALICVYEEAGTVIETYEQAAEWKQ